MKARAPRLGDKIMREGMETLIVAFPLYQPAAPKFFEVVDSGNRRLFVSWHGQAWVEYGKEKSRREEHEGREDAFGDLPTHTIEPDSQGDRGLGRGSAPIDCFTMEIKRGGESGSSRRNGRRSQAKSIPAPRIHQDLTPLLPARREAIGDGHRPPLQLKRAPNSLHLRLNQARDAYQRARDAENLDDDLIASRFEAYTALIGEVDRVDPGFYLGAVR